MKTPNIRHLAYRVLGRVRHGRNLLSWLDEQATRLAITKPEVFDLLRTMTAKQVEGLPSGGPGPDPDAPYNIPTVTRGSVAYTPDSFVFFGQVGQVQGSFLDPADDGKTVVLTMSSAFDDIDLDIDTDYTDFCGQSSGTSCVYPLDCAEATVISALSVDARLALSNSNRTGTLTVDITREGDYTAAMIHVLDGSAFKNMTAGKMAVELSIDMPHLVSTQASAIVALWQFSNAGNTNRMALGLSRAADNTYLLRIRDMVANTDLFSDVAARPGPHKYLLEFDADTSTLTLKDDSGVPYITGVPTDGEVLTANDGQWAGTPAPDMTYQWKKDGVDIDGETAATYTLVTADVDSQITCVVTATNSHGTASIETDFVGPIAAAAP